MLASSTDMLTAVWSFLADPVAGAAWTDWRDFWLTRIVEGRYLVAYFLPLLPVLLILRRDRLRAGIVVTGLLFLAYVFGAAYAVFWLVAALAFHRLGERFAVECRRTDVWTWGPPLAAGFVLVGWHAATLGLHHVWLPAELNAWLYKWLPWVYPLGVRGADWEPFFRALHHAPATNQPPQFLVAVFRDVHLIGTAYLTVRLFQYFSEIKRGNLPPERRTRLNFLAFVCYAPTLTQGPLERFAEFQAEMDTCHERRSWRNVLPAAGRMGLGLFKNFVVFAYLQPVLHDRLGLEGNNAYYETPEQIESFWLLYVGAGLQITRLYLAFSGYCDVSAGMARLLGYRQIENFRRPWLATSMRDMWRRWHISLSFILRDYVYIALGGNRRHVTVNLIVTFVVCGIWHALVGKMAAWGLVMGLMVLVNQYWVQWMKRLDAQPASGWAAVRRGCQRLRPLPQIAAWLLTQHAFVWSTLIIFGGVSGTYRVTREMLRRVWGALT